MSETPEAKPDNIYTLKIVTPEYEANQDCIELLEYYLAMAKNGEIITCAIAALKPGTCARYGYSHTKEQLRLIGALELVKSLLLEPLLSSAVAVEETEPEGTPDA